MSVPIGEKTWGHPRRAKREKVETNQGAGRNSEAPESKASWQNKRLPQSRCGPICNPERSLGDQVGMAHPKGPGGRENLKWSRQLQNEAHHNLTLGSSWSGRSPGYQCRGPPKLTQVGGPSSWV